MISVIVFRLHRCIMHLCYKIMYTTIACYLNTHTHDCSEASSLFYIRWIGCAFFVAVASAQLLLHVLLFWFAPDSFFHIVRVFSMQRYLVGFFVRIQFPIQTHLETQFDMEKYTSIHLIYFEWVLNLHSHFYNWTFYFTTIHTIWSFEINFLTLCWRL